MGVNATNISGGAAMLVEVSDSFLGNRRNCKWLRIASGSAMRCTSTLDSIRQLRDFWWGRDRWRL